ncbi:MAG TPA: Ig-like domain-containing protein, partial [Verrucomicrobiae bacterium]|nr:Ig-like domain-containing protein [Verrucomicrobiae bacterium]
MKLPRIVAAMAALFTSILWAEAGTNVLVSTGSFWTYLDNGSNQGTNWAYPGFNDGAWSFGAGPFGYGNNETGLGTIISYGPNPLNKYITTYFRQTIELADTDPYTILRLNVRRDDGIAVYLNGIEVFRNNLIVRAPYNSLATNAPDNGVVVFTTTINPLLLVPGDNLVAAEVHQQSISDPDLRFDLELLASTDPTTNNVPNVAISSPANNTFFIQPPSVNIQASASDVDGTILKVEFYRNGAKLGEDTTPPYSFLWVNPPVGTHTLTARATDNLAGRTFSSPVTITVGVSAPPVITSVVPSAGTVSNLTQIRVNFSEPVSGVQASDLLINGRPAITLIAGTTNFTFGFPPPTDGTVLVAFSGAHGIEDFEPNPRAFDNFAANASWQYTLTDRAAPTVVGLDPSAGATVQSVDQVSVTFSEAVWGVDAADLLINGTPASSVSGSGTGPYRFSFNAISNGTVQLNWALNHGIKDFASAPNAFAGGSWSYTIDPSAQFEGRIIINEIMYHPQSERTSEEYIELRNTGSGPVNLTGWRLNRGVDYVFPTLSIPAGGYIVIAANLPAFAARYGNVGTVVGPWEGSLNNGGEEIELEDALGNQVDLVRYADEGDWSVRRRFSGNGWEWYSEHDGLGKSLELVNMRLDNGIPQNWAPSLTLHGTPGALNSVATNNAPPLISDVAHSPAIPKSTETVTIKARVVDESIAGLTVTLKYREVTAAGFSSAPMFDDGNHNDGGTGDGIYAANVSALGVATIVEFYIEATDSTGHRRTWPRQIGDGGPEPNPFYQVDDENYAGGRPIYRLIMRPQDRADFFNFQDRVPRNATFITVEGGEVEIHYACTVRRRGASSFGATPPTFKLDIPRDHPWNGKSSVNMNSVSTWAQVLGSAIALKSGLAVAHARGVQVRFNGQNMSSAGSQMYGMYAAVEVLNDEWADDFFPDDGQGNVYSKRRPECALEYRGTDPQAYINCAYDKESNGSQNDWSDLVKLLAALDPDTTSDADYVSAVRRNVNVEMWMRYFAVLHLMNYNETALVTGSDDDYSMYRGVADPRFLILPHDFDSVFGSQGVNNFGIYQPANIPNINRLLRHPQFEPLYHDEFRRQLAGVFSTNELFQLMDQVLSDWAPGELQNMKNVAVARRNS